MAVVAERLHRSSGAEPDSFEAMFAVWCELDPPVRYRAEIIEGAIVMTPPPGGPHSQIDSTVTKALVPLLSADVGIYHAVGVKIDSVERLYEPDVVIAPTGALGEEVGVVAAADVLLVAEITSRSTAHVDRGDKLRAFAAGDVPMYLLLDRVRKNPTVTLYTDPVDGEYQHVVTVPFGETIRLPAPFDTDLDTTQFPR